VRSKSRRRAAARPVARVSRARVPRAESSRRLLPRFRQRLALGDSLSLSPFCLGLVSDWRLLPAAFEMGINFFFLSTDMHWPLYEANRRGLKALLASRKGIRDEVAIVGTCYLTQPKSACERVRTRSLRGCSRGVAVEDFFIDLTSNQSS
jgi:hypothetical protein